MPEWEPFGLEGLEAPKVIKGYIVLCYARLKDIWVVDYMGRMYDPRLYDPRLYAHSLLWIFWKCVMGCLGLPEC